MRAEVSDLLRSIPTDLDLAYAPLEFISGTRAPSTLWYLLRGLRGMGRTKTSKLLARKRPRLIPVWDSVVASEWGLATTNGFWTAMARTLQADNCALHDRLCEVRKKAGLGEEISALRIFDVITWMTGKARK